MTSVSSSAPTLPAAGQPLGERGEAGDVDEDERAVEGSEGQVRAVRRASGSAAGGRTASGSPRLSVDACATNGPSSGGPASVRHASRSRGRDQAGGLPIEGTAARCSRDAGPRRGPQPHPGGDRPPACRPARGARRRRAGDLTPAVRPRARLGQGGSCSASRGSRTRSTSTSRSRERTDGPVREISAKAPHLATKMDRPREEHPVLRERTTRSSPSSRPPRSARRGRSTRRATTCSGSSAQVVRHRQRGSDLVWEAYNLDIGGTE